MRTPDEMRLDIRHAWLMCTADLWHQHWCMLCLLRSLADRHHLHVRS